MTTIPEKDLALYRVNLVKTLVTSRYVLATDVRECEHATSELARTVETNACAIESVTHTIVPLEGGGAKHDEPLMRLLHAAEERQNSMNRPVKKAKYCFMKRHLASSPKGSETAW